MLSNANEPQMSTDMFSLVLMRERLREGGRGRAAHRGRLRGLLRFAHPAGGLTAGDLPAVGSLIIRRFLGYALTEQTPDHSSLSVFRQRLPEEVFAAAHEVVLEGLRTHGLLKGRHLGIDSSVMEAHASLSGLVRRNDEKSYWNYVRELAKEAGVDAEDPDAVARFDRHRKERKTSNKE